MQRLKTRAQFQAVLSGVIVAKTAHFALHRKVLTAEPQLSLSNEPIDAPGLFRVQDFWIGAMVPKRWAKRAVTRNAIKRQIYTVSADFSQHYFQSALVVRLRSSFVRTKFFSAVSDQLKQAVRTEVQALMQAGANAG